MQSNILSTYKGGRLVKGEDAQWGFSPKETGHIDDAIFWGRGYSIADLSHLC